MSKAYVIYILAYVLMAAVIVCDISKHGALTGASFVIPLISAVILLLLEVIRDSKKR